MRFVESHLDKSIAFQIRSLRDNGKWTQAEFAEKLGIKHQNNVSARLENPNYGKHTLSTLKKIAATCDVALVVWFVPFSRLLNWVTGTPYLDNGLSEAFYNVPSFECDPGLRAYEMTSAVASSSNPIGNAAASFKRTEDNNAESGRKPMETVKAELAICSHGGR